MPASPRLLPALLAVCAVLVLTAAPARADSAAEERAVVVPASWGLATMEVSTIGYLALRFGAKVLPKDGSGGALLANLTPAVLGGVMAYTAYRYDLDPAPALAVHGAVWVGADLALIGMLIDGHGERTGMDTGTATLVLGTVGVIGGGVLGATVGDGWPQAWLTGPVVGLAGGTLLGGLYGLTFTGLDSDLLFQRFMVGAAAGMTTGLVIGAVGGYTRNSGTTAAPRHVLVPRVEPGPHQMVVSFGGAF